MKKLISILLMLMVLISGVAMAEEPTAEPSATPVVDATTEPAADATAEPTADATAEPAADATAEPTEVTEETEQKVDWSQVSMLNKGLIVTAGGLTGTFLVLILFFLGIKLMQKVLK